MTKSDHIQYMKDYRSHHRENGDVLGYIFVTPAGLIEVPPEVNELELETEDMYCAVFGCGRKLNLKETLHGSKCMKHSEAEIKIVGKIK